MPRCMWWFTKGGEAKPSKPVLRKTPCYSQAWERKEWIKAFSFTASCLSNLKHEKGGQSLFEFQANSDSTLTRPVPPYQGTKMSSDAMCVLLLEEQLFTHLWDELLHPLGVLVTQLSSPAEVRGRFNGRRCGIGRRRKALELLCSVSHLSPLVPLEAVPLPSACSWHLLCTLDSHGVGWGCSATHSSYPLSCQNKWGRGFLLCFTVKHLGVDRFCHKWQLFFCSGGKAWHRSTELAGLEVFLCTHIIASSPDLPSPAQAMH